MAALHSPGFNLAPEVLFVCDPVLHLSGHVRRDDVADNRLGLA